MQNHLQQATLEPITCQSRVVLHAAHIAYHPLTARAIEMATSLITRQFGFLMSPSISKTI